MPGQHLEKPVEEEVCAVCGVVRGLKWTSHFIWVLAAAARSTPLPSEPWARSGWPNLGEACAPQA